MSGVAQISQLPTDRVLFQFIENFVRCLAADLAIFIHACVKPPAQLASTDAELLLYLIDGWLWKANALHENPRSS
jgi:hypothetical protein